MPAHLYQLQTQKCLPWTRLLIGENNHAWSIVCDFCFVNVAMNELGFVRQVSGVSVSVDHEGEKNIRVSYLFVQLQCMSIKFAWNVRLSNYTALAHFHCNCLWTESRHSTDSTHHFDWLWRMPLLNISTLLVALSTKIQCPLWPANQHHNYPMNHGSSDENLR